MGKKRNHVRIVDVAAFRINPSHSSSWQFAVRTHYHTQGGSAFLKMCRLHPTARAIICRELPEHQKVLVTLNSLMEGNTVQNRQEDLNIWRYNPKAHMTHPYTLRVTIYTVLSHQLWGTEGFMEVYVIFSLPGIGHSRVINTVLVL